MMIRSKRALFSIIATFLLFISLLFLSLSIFRIVDPADWLMAFLQWRIVFMPAVVFLMGFSLISGIALFFLLGHWQRSLLKPVETAVHQLASGYFEEQLISLSPTLLTAYPALKGIAEDIGVVRQTLRTISQELQLLTAQPIMISGQTKEEILELERQRLARELHDSVSQELFAAMMLLAALNETAQKSAASSQQQKQLELITTIINTAQSEMRALLLHLRPVNLEGKSLKTGIEQLLTELASKVTIHIDWFIEDLTLPSTIEDQLFRVIQELLSNTLRHAKAEDLEVYLKQIDQTILLRFIDDGVGFDVAVEKAGSYGLLNIKERIHSIGGIIKIISFKGKGTSVEIKIPIFKGGSEV